MKFLVILIVSIVIFILAVKYLEQTSIFYPEKEITDRPNDIGLEYEDIYFKTEDGILINGWFIKNLTAESTLLFFHGNAGNISHRLHKINLFHNLGLNVFIVDYRGYGKSDGRPTEEGLYKDARAAYDYLLTRHDIQKDKIIAYGASLGGVAAIDLATHRDLVALIVDSSFSTAKDIAKQVYPFVPSILISTKMDSQAKVKTIEIPKLFLHSRDDEVVPFELGRKLFDAAVKPKEFVEIKGGHNTSYEESEEILSKTIFRFLTGQELL
ncbi:MAG: alpha/beta hydrolase [Candidatus Aceula meridiana]|nr:alpha/beta hydrolase [Candidatus Aceula meridiana]